MYDVFVVAKWARLFVLVVLMFFNLPPSEAQEVSVFPTDGFTRQAQTFLKKRQFDSARYMFQQSRKKYLDEGDYASVSFLQAEIARTWLASRNFEKAKAMSEAILADKRSSKDALVLAYQNLATGFVAQSRDLKSALRYNHKALAIVLSMEHPGLERKAKATQPIAYNHYAARNFDSAYYYFNKLIAYARQKVPPKPSAVAFYQLQMINLLHVHARFTEARPWLENVVQIIEELPMTTFEEYGIAADYYANLGYNYTHTDRPDSALWANLLEEKARLNSPIVDSVKLARIQNNISSTYFLKGDLNKSWEFAQKAFEIRKQVLHADHYSLASSYRSLGQHRLKQSYAIKEAQEYFHEAMRISEKNFTKKHPYTIIEMQNLANSYEISQEYQEAISIYKEALSLQQAIEGENNLRTGRLYLSLALTYTNAEQYEEAKGCFDRYFNISEHLTSGRVMFEARGMMGLGRLYLKLQDFDRAKTQLQGALPGYMETYSSDNQILAEVYNDMAIAYQGLGDWEEALRSLEKAIEVNVLDQESTASGNNSSDMIVKNRIRFIDSNLIKTRMQLAQSFELDDDGLKDEAWQTFRHTEALLQQWINEQNSASDIITLQTYNRELYTVGIHALWQQDSVSTENAIEMWKLSEKSKAIHQRLKERRRNLSDLGEVPRKILEEESELNADINYYRSLLINQKVTDTARARLFELLQEKRAFEQRVKDEFPKYSDVISETGMYDIAEVTARIHPDLTVVDYFMTAHALYAFLLTSEGIQLYKLRDVEDLNELISTFNSALLGQKKETFAEAAVDLYQAVFEPLEKSVRTKSLLIIPDMGLWQVNFDLLLSSEPSSNDLRSYNYLIKQYAIHYAYSVSLLASYDSRKSHGSSKVLAFAYGEDKTDLPITDVFRDGAKGNIPGTAMEVRNLSTKMEGDFYYGDMANESRFKAIAPDFSILHLALHGEVDDREPDHSGLFFTDADSSATEDNVLHAFELYDMKLNADLAVLSACNTGSGRVNNGEGIMSLGKAFQYAGVNSVLLSKWEVSDVVAPKVMDSFYTNLVEGMSKAEALRQAKLTFLEGSNSITAHPYYWGSFFILGDDRPMNLKGKKEWFYWFLGVTLLAVILIRRRKRNSAILP